MIVQAYADNSLIYDSRLEGYALLALQVHTYIDKGGSAEFVLPPEHPAYNDFVAHKTIIRIYRGTELVFRGRVLYPSDDFYGRRTITCEGERCFLQDAVMRPYLYQADPATIFRDIISKYNAQVDESKQFAVGNVTVTDPNDYVRLEADSAGQISDVVKKLVERCGGYITFGYDDDGKRTINWLATLSNHSLQAIEFGENLLDYTRDDSNTDLATAILPYGAKGKDEKRLTIESVNDGVDYIQDDAAVALRGFICKPVVWDDITIPANLLTKARQYLAQSKLIVTTLSLSAVDLSALDSSIDRFSVGDTVRVRSKPHGVDDDFRLTERTYNLLDPSQDTVTLGGTTATLTGSDVDSSRKNTNDLNRIETSTRSDYQSNLAQIKETERTCMSAIQQASDLLQSYVENNYVTTEAQQRVVEQLQTLISQTADALSITISKATEQITDVNGDLTAYKESIATIIRATIDGVEIGKSDSPYTAVLSNDRLEFRENGVCVAYISNNRMHITDLEVTHSARLTCWEFKQRSNGHGIIRYRRLT